MEGSSYDYTSYFKYTQDILSQADFAVANMEFVCGVPPYTGYSAFSAPLSLAESAVESGIDLFLCANNHIFDKGQKGAEQTMLRYETLGIPYTGIYRSREERDSLSPYMADIGGIRCAFINFTYGTNLAASKAIVGRMDTTYVSESIRKAKGQGADFIIALPHWGVEYSLAPSPQQKKWEEFLYRAGADAIVGSHPHVIQPINTIRDDSGRIKHTTAYSLGNFISNMSAKNTQAGFIFVLKLVKEGDRCTIVSGEPVWIWCARGGRFEKNYTTLPILDFIGESERFPIRHEYDNMVETYHRLREIIDNYGK
jgi:poly-gamma-glutamate synthesis protein (capsule biosynthesis protein)